MSSNKLSCLIDILPSFASSKDPAKIPALPVLLTVSYTHLRAHETS